MKTKLFFFIAALFCANFISAQDPVLNCAASGDGNGTICTMSSTVFSLSSNCGLPNTEFVISDPTTTIDPDGSPGTGDEGLAVLGVSITSDFDAATFGLSPGDAFCVTPVCYDLTQVQDLIDGIYESNIIRDCCNIVEDFVPDLCNDLMGAGINSGSDIASLRDLVTIAGIFSGGPITLESVVDVIGQLNDNLSLLGLVGCSNGVSNIDYAVNGVNENTNTGTPVTCCFTVVNDIETCADAVTCQAVDITHSGTINTGLFKVSNSITSTATIGNNQNVIYEAGNVISLNDVFRADGRGNGAVFTARIAPCSFVNGKIDESTDEGITFKNYPNPFTGQTTIEFTLLKDTPVTLSVSDATGREVEVLLDSEAKATGTHLMTFDGSNYPAGMYYYTIQAGEYVGTQKMVLIK